mgnify:CR=1 FL=1
MKKIKSYSRAHRFPRREVHRISFFASEGRKLYAAKIELAFRNGGDKIVAKTIIYNDKECYIVRWLNHRYYVIPFRSRHLYAKPYRMTLAKYKQLNGNLA